ncbi:MAG: hypothetical protein LBS77_05115 [Desulfovibrio sp.]|jgi:hypothetical protein|nr:hypothetical protein [Desulfovibrio sp.]
MAIFDRIAILSNGKLQQLGQPLGDLFQTGQTLCGVIYRRMHPAECRPGPCGQWRDRND